MVRQEVSKPSTNLTISWDKKGAGVKHGTWKSDQKVRGRELGELEENAEVIKKNLPMVISGLLTWCVYALSKEASGKYSEDQICLILSNRRKYVVKQLRSQQVECFCKIFDCMVKYGAGLLSLLKREMSGFGIFCPSIFKKI